MEPALDERGDLGSSATGILTLSPQWSPLSTSGATEPAITIALLAEMPQWSPLSTSGAT